MQLDIYQICIIRLCYCLDYCRNDCIWAKANEFTAVGIPSRATLCVADGTSSGCSDYVMRGGDAGTSATTRIVSGYSRYYKH